MFAITQVFYNHDRLWGHVGTIHAKTPTASTFFRHIRTTSRWQTNTMAMFILCFLTCGNRLTGTLVRWIDDKQHAKQQHRSSRGFLHHHLNLHRQKTLLYLLSFPTHLATHIMIVNSKFNYPTPGTSKPPSSKICKILLSLGVWGRLSPHEMSESKTNAARQFKKNSQASFQQRHLATREKAYTSFMAALACTFVRIPCLQSVDIMDHATPKHQGPT